MFLPLAPHCLPRILSTLLFFRIVLSWFLVSPLLLSIVKCLSPFPLAAFMRRFPRNPVADLGFSLEVGPPLSPHMLLIETEMEVAFPGD